MSLKRDPLAPAQADPAAHVALLWVDNANLTRCRVLPLARFQQPNFQLELTNAIMSMPSMHDAPFDSPVGVVHLVPDRDRNQPESDPDSSNGAQSTKLHDISSWMAETRACFGDMAKNGAVWEQCPRTFLRRQEQRLLDTLGVRATIGFELEFQLLRQRSSGELEPVDSTLYCELRALHTSSSWQVLREIVECLQTDLGISVYQYHPESGSGQFEISIGHDGNARHCQSEQTSLVDAVDQLVLARQTVYGVATKHGLHATFVPKLKLNETGNGAHIHLGLVDVRGASSPAARENLFKSRTATASSFLAGILDELPGMLMLLAPTTNSYERLQPHCWAGAHCCYGFENREAAIRLIGTNCADDIAKIDHFELKTVDAIANPYVAVGALLAAGIAGVERSCVLPEPMTSDPAALSADEQPEVLPQSLEHAIAAFSKRAELWNAVLSPPYAELLVSLRRAESEYYGKLTRDEMLEQLVRRY